MKKCISREKLLRNRAVPLTGENTILDHRFSAIDGPDGLVGRLRETNSHDASARDCCYWKYGVFRFFKQAAYLPRLSDPSDLSDNRGTIRFPRSGIRRRIEIFAAELRKKRSVRQIDPAFVAAVTGNIGRFVDQFREIVEHAAAPLRIVVINERLPSDHLDPSLPPEKLTGDAAFLLKINEFEHIKIPFRAKIKSVKASGFCFSMQ